MQLLQALPLDHRQLHLHQFSAWKASFPLPTEFWFLDHQEWQVQEITVSQIEGHVTIIIDKDFDRLTE